MKKQDSTKYIRQMFWKPNIAPMYYILLFLLVSFLTAVPMHTHGGRIELPEAEFVQDEPLDGLPVVWIKRDGEVYFEERYIEDISTLPSMLKKTWEGNYDFRYKILLKADMDTEFGMVQQVLKAAQSVHIETVGLLAEAVSR